MKQTNDLNISPLTTEVQATGFLVFYEIRTIKHLLHILTAVQEIGISPSMRRKKKTHEASKSKYNYKQEGSDCV